MFHSRLPKASFRGGNLGGWGTVPPKFEVGDGPCIRPSNILRSSVVGCVRKYEKSKRDVFLVRKGLCTISNKVKIRKIREKRWKIRKTWSMTKRKKGHQKFLPRKWKFYPKKTSSWSAKNFSVPQTRRQVSATGPSFIAFASISTIVVLILWCGPAPL